MAKLFLQNQMYRCKDCKNPIRVMTLGERNAKRLVIWQKPFAKECKPCGIAQQINIPKVIELFATFDHLEHRSFFEDIINSGELLEK